MGRVRDEISDRRSLAFHTFRKEMNYYLFLFPAAEYSIYF